MDMSKLLPPQRPHSIRLLNSLHINGFAFDSSPTGVGKTFCASWGAKYFNAPTVVVCPKSVKSDWASVMASFGVKPHAIVNYESLTRGKTPYYTYNTKEYDECKTWWTSGGINVNLPPRSLVIVDEAHKCKGLNSLNSEMLVAMRNAGHKILMLSATAASCVAEMKAFGYVTLLHGGNDFNDFCVENGANFNRWGGMEWDNTSNKSVEGMKNIHNLLYKFTNCASRMNRKDFGSFFPDNKIVTDSFDLGGNTAKLKQVYENMQAELDALDERAANYSSHHFAIMMKARRHSELLKVPSMVEWIEDMYDEGISPVVFVNFTDTLEGIKKKLLRKNKFQGTIATIEGGQSQKQRDAEIASFQADAKRIMLVTIQSGAASISLHDLNGNYPRHTLLNPSFSAFDLKQAVGRCHRANGKTPVIQRFFFAEGVDVEERMRERVQTRLNNIDTLNDGDISYEINLKN
jgi:superfamily II DNA or RNA helicase